VVKVVIIQPYIRELAAFIGKSEDVRTYLHNTAARETADNIIREGFQFQESLRKTTDMMVNPEDHTEMNWWNAQRGNYGIYTVVLQIARPVLSKYMQSSLLPEMLLSKDRFYSDDAEDWMYILQPQYVKGYFDRNKEKGFSNPSFNPYHDDEALAMLNAERFEDIGPRIRTHKL
jgi:hypothetical protein